MTYRPSVTRRTCPHMFCVVRSWLLPLVPSEFNSERDSKTQELLSLLVQLQEPGNCPPESLRKEVLAQSLTEVYPQH